MNGMQEIPQEKYNPSSEQEWKKAKEHHQAFHTAILETQRTNRILILFDKESAKVVKRIYRLVIEGYGVTQIADILTKDKVLFCKRRKARISKSDEQVIR